MPWIVQICQSHISVLMIGRGALMDTGLCSQIREPEANQMRENMYAGRCLHYREETATYRIPHKHMVHAKTPEPHMATRIRSLIFRAVHSTACFFMDNKWNNNIMFKGRLFVISPYLMYFEIIRNIS